MNVLMISPGYPGEMPFFARGLVQAGARVFGVGDQAESQLPEIARQAVTAHLRVPDLWDEPAVVERVRHESAKAGVRFHRVECLWEPGMFLAARLREALGCPGLTVKQTVAFRDKEVMKQVLDAAGIRTPWHKRARTFDEVRAAAHEVGFPVIVKPIAGAGSTDTHRVDGPGQLEAVLPSLRHVTEVSVEEYVDGDELTFDTVCARGEILYENVSFYRPRPIEEKKHEWISPSSICLRRIDAPELDEGRSMGRRVLAALGFDTGFSHMEWYRKSDGEVVFGEIGARPPGAHMVEAMNYASDVDLFRGWAEAIVHGRFTQPIERRYNSAIVCKRAVGQGVIRGVSGLDRLRDELGPALVAVEILPPGTPRRDWRQSAVSDGFVIVRHPELQETFRLADRIANELRIHAG
jgi:hypothetical protein